MNVDIVEPNIMYSYGRHIRQRALCVLSVDNVFYAKSILIPIYFIKIDGYVKFIHLN